VTRVGAFIAPAGSEALDDADEADVVIWQSIASDVLLQTVWRLPEAIASRVRRTLPTLWLDGSAAPSTECWMNHCSGCGSRMGDFYLHMEADAPFFSLDQLRADEFESVRLDGGEIECAMPYLAQPPKRRIRSMR
jgi:hypothetical protein